MKLYWSWQIFKGRVVPKDRLSMRHQLGTDSISNTIKGTATNLIVANLRVYTHIDPSTYN